MSFTSSRAKFWMMGFAAFCLVAALAPQAHARATYFTFDVPGAVQYGREAGVNGSGVVFGSFQDNRGLWHGFVRAPDGAITQFDATGATNTYPMAMNDQGVIVGYMHLSGQIAERAFIRNADGSFSRLYPKPSYSTLMIAKSSWGTPASAPSSSGKMGN